MLAERRVLEKSDFKEEKWPCILSALQPLLLSEITTITALRSKENIWKPDR